MRTHLVRPVLALLAFAPTFAPAQSPRRLEFGALFGASQINMRSRYPGESRSQPYLGVRSDARLVHLGAGTLGVSAFWDRYRYDEVSFQSCDQLCLAGGPYVPPHFHLTGGDQFASRLGGGLTWQVPIRDHFLADVGAMAGRFARTGSPGSGFAALSDKTTSQSFLGAEAGVTSYWRDLALGFGYEYNHAWRVHGNKPTAHRFRMRLAYALPLGVSRASRQTAR